ncbi:MAG: AlkZ family DNA glycosylase [Solirubrobacterales bacterium]|nr:AlkZ family DNA glycosylase [Solirubrobacterales bacterium]
MSDGARTLTLRALNRALLARQMLLERQDRGVLDTLAHLIGIQAQEPQAPYLALWTRIDGFHASALSELIETRAAVRASLMRATIHLVTAADYPPLWALTSTVLARAFRGSQFRRALNGVDLDALAYSGRELLTQRPLSRAELGARLAQLWPHVDPDALAYGVTLLSAVVQVPPRGLWRRPGPARLSRAEDWLGISLDQRPDPETMIVRYLAAYGPASAHDIQTWSGVSRLAPVLEGLRDRLCSFFDADGRELFDIAGAPLPEADVPAPPRFLAPFDNAILAHHNRRRIIAPSHRSSISRDPLMRVFLVDGFAAGTWSEQRGTMHITPFAPLSPGDETALIDEADQTLAFLAPESAHRIVLEAAEP